MYGDPNKGWLARKLERRRVERQEACERAHRRQEEVDELLAEYPVDRSRAGKTSSTFGRASAGDFGGDIGLWSGFGGDSGSDGGFWSGFGGDWGGGGDGGC
jgi:hypothetical protein